MKYDLGIHGFPIQKTSTPSVFPAEWLPLPSLTEGDQQFSGLYAVYPHDSNYVAIKAAGAITVDWGDGVVENFAANALAGHNFAYSAISDSTLCSRGYRQVVITVTPQSGQTLTMIDLQQRPAVANLGYYCPQWLDIVIAGQQLVALTISGNGQRLKVLERFTFIGSNQVANFTSLFYYCSALRNVPLFYTAMGTTFTQMFQGCTAIGTIPVFDTSLGTLFSSMFRDCASLEFIPAIDTAKGVDHSGFALGCTALQVAPALNTALTLTVANMFSGCSALQILPAYDLSSCSVYTTMLTGCVSLSKLSAIGIAYTISIASAKMSRTSLVELFTNLASVTGQTITISSNWGAALLTAGERAIATTKGWTITG